MKLCIRCKQEKSISDFVKSRKSRDGLSCYCKSCWTAYQKAKYEASKHATKILVETKICSRCKKEKTSSEFCRKITSRDGLCPRCKDCDYAARGHNVRLKPPTLILTNEQSAYLAGLLDGEGYISLACRRRTAGQYKGNHLVYARMVIAMTTSLVREFQAEYKIGRVSYVEAKNPKYKGRYDWHIYPNECRALLPLVIPYLKVKKRQAELLLQYLKLAEHRNRSESYKKEVIELCQQLRVLNKRGR